MDSEQQRVEEKPAEAILGIPPEKLKIISSFFRYNAGIDASIFDFLVELPIESLNQLSEYLEPRNSIVYYNAFSFFKRLSGELSQNDNLNVDNIAVVSSIIDELKKRETENKKGETERIEESQYLEKLISILPAFAEFFEKASKDNSVSIKGIFEKIHNYGLEDEGHILKELLNVSSDVGDFSTKLNIFYKFDREKPKILLEFLHGGKLGELFQLDFLEKYIYSRYEIPGYDFSLEELLEIISFIIDFEINNPNSNIDAYSISFEILNNFRTKESYLYFIRNFWKLYEFGIINIFNLNITYFKEMLSSEGLTLESFIESMRQAGFKKIKSVKTQYERKRNTLEFYKLINSGGLGEIYEDGFLYGYDLEVLKGFNGVLSTLSKMELYKYEKIMPHLLRKYADERNEEGNSVPSSPTEEVAEGVAKETKHIVGENNK